MRVSIVFTRGGVLVFTGTPIDKADANTQAVFGGYVSGYDIEGFFVRFPILHLRLSLDFRGRRGTSGGRRGSVTLIEAPLQWICGETLQPLCWRGALTRVLKQAEELADVWTGA